jgi:general secretion pathway protein D
MVIALVSALGGCAAEKSAAPPYFKEIYEETRPEAAAEGADAQGGTVLGGAVADARKGSVKIIAVPNPMKKEMVTAAGEKAAPRGTGAAVKDEPLKTAELSVQAASGDVQVIVEGMPIYEFVNLAFGELMKLNYTVAPEVQGMHEKVTLNMGRKMKGSEFFPFAVDLMRKHNLEVTDGSGVLYVNKKGTSSKEVIAASPDVYVGNTVPRLPSQKKITLIVGTSYVPANQILQVVKQLQIMSGDVRGEAILSNQAVALSGSIASLEKIVPLFNQLDRPSFVQREFNLVYLDYMNVSDFDKKLREVLPATGIPIARSPGDPGIMLIPFEKINAILIASSQKDWMESLLSWKEKLDAVESMGDEMQLFIFRPKNRAADELVEVLKAVSNGGSHQGIAVQQEPAKTAPALTAAQKKQQAAQAAAAPVHVDGVNTAALPVKGFNAFLDKGRNAVIVSASPANFKLIRNILTQLDTPPRQVLFEATIMEVTLTDNLQYGVEWLIKHTINSPGAGNYDAVVGTLGGLALGGSGLNYAITKLPGDFQAKINAYANKNLINIVSTPHIATLDGKEATITVGTEVPIVTAETSAADITGTTGNQPSILRNVQYRNTGTILRVKPVINSDGALTIEVGQELSEAQTNSVSSIDSPLILNRSIHTTLSCKSGDTVLIGGLISTNKSKGESKVPILGDIPLIGNLFKTTSAGSTKTELIVQITPYILNDLDQLDDITAKFKDQVFLEKIEDFGVVRP